MTKIEQIRNNFMKETYQDTWNVYQNSINNDKFEYWDYIVLTASNKEQAETYKREIDFRLNKNFLSKSCKYLVLEDPEGKRVGSRRCNFKCIKGNS